MKKLFKAALVVATIAGFQAMGTLSASANQVDLTQYAKDPGVKDVTKYKSVKVAGYRSRRRNRNLAGGLLAAGVAAIIINEAVRSGRRNDRYYYDNDRYYDNRSYGYSRSYNRNYDRTCRKYARRCDRGSRRSCRKWNRYCR